jgi:hypothetical protein
VLKNTLPGRDKDVSLAIQTRKCLNRRERVRTCAGLATLKKVRKTFFNILLESRAAGGKRSQAIVGARYSRAMRNGIARE